MDSQVKNLHYAIGEIVYAIAHADGKIHKEEREKLHAIVEAELRCKDYDFDLAEIIFQLLDRDKHDSETAYYWGMHEMITNGYYLSPQLKANFIKVAEKIAKAYPPVTPKKQTLLDKFKKDIAGIEGDPVFYGKPAEKKA